MRESIIYDTLSSYESYINMCDNVVLQSDLITINKCREYLDNGGEATEKWLYSNDIFFSRAFHYYHKNLDRLIRDPDVLRDNYYAGELRARRKQVIKYESMFKYLEDYII